MAKQERLAATRTSRHFFGKSKAEGCDGVEYFDAPPSPPGRFFVPRLSFGSTPKVPYDVEGFSRSLATHPDRPLFFCDTSFFDRKTDTRLYEALLASTGTVVITPDVRRELEPWITSNPASCMAQAFLSGASPIEFRDYDTTSSGEPAASMYYVNLLGFRKKMVALARLQFENAHGRPPDEIEVRAVLSELHQRLGPRGYLLARKGEEGRGSSNRFTDESLVYSAFADGIRSGRPVIILTKDEDIQEQFYKQQQLLDTQYRAMLFADAYFWNPGAFATRPMPMSGAFADAFAGERNILVERPKGIEQALLPSSFEFVPIRCFVLGDGVLTETHFGAERQMERLLHIKGATGGLNTIRFNGQNCHFWLAPMPIDDSLRGYAAIAHDQRLPVGKSGVAIPSLDVNQAVFSKERFRRLVPNEAGSPLRSEDGD